MTLTSDWWTCKESRRRINAEQDRRIIEQIAEINRAYKAAKIPGPTPKHWLGKIKRMNELGRPMPKGLEHLSGSSIDDNSREFIESGKKAVREYFAAEYAEIRAKNFKRIQNRYAKSNTATKSQAKGGRISGAARRLARDKAAFVIVDAYNKAHAANVNIKPVARIGASWHIKNFPSTRSLRATVQLLQRAGVAT